MGQAVATVDKVKIEKFEQGKRYLIEGEFTKSPSKTTKGEPYWRVEIKDNSGKASQNAWNNLPIYPVLTPIDSGQWVKAEVVCSKLGQYTNIEIHSIEVVEKIEESLVSMEKLKDELRSEISSIADEDLRTLISNVFKRADVRELFWTAPASQKSAYSFTGGLASHVIRLIRLSKSVAEVFNGWDQNLNGLHSKLNVDLLKTACILHDIGKVNTFVKKGHSFDKTDEGKLFEDSYLSMKIVLEELPKVKLPDYQKMILEHVLGGSKGQQRFGALNIPRSREAIAFHFLDALDIQMANFEHLDRDADATELFAQLFEKQLFLGMYDGE